MATGAVPISIGATVDIGGGRGRLAPNPAASLRRIDAQLGRLADVNDAWRSPEVADENRRKWLAYQNGTGPAAPYALDRWGSIHCRGYAADSDDWYNGGAAGVWRRNGWRQTARYPDSRDEPWHGEYDESLDEYFTGSAAGGSTPFEEEDMNADQDRALAAVWQFSLRASQILEALDVRTGNAQEGNLAIAAERLKSLPAEVWGHHLQHPVTGAQIAAGEFERFGPAEHANTHAAIADLTAKVDALTAFVEKLVPKASA